MNFKIEDTLVKENGGENAGHMQHAVTDKKKCFIFGVAFINGNLVFLSIFFYKNVCAKAIL